MDSIRLEILAYNQSCAPINAIEFLKCLNEPHSYHIHGHELEGMHADWAAEIRALAAGKFFFFF